MVSFVVANARAGRDEREAKAAARREPDVTQVDIRRAVDVNDNGVGATKADMMGAGVVEDGNVERRRIEWGGGGTGGKSVLGRRYGYKCGVTVGTPNLGV